MKTKKLNVGCGNDYKKGYWNIDNDVNVKTDQLVNIRKRLPYEDETFNEILLYDVIEHFYDPIPILEELVRVSKSNGKIVIKTPYGLDGLNNLDHKKLFNLGSFNTRNFKFTNNIKPIVEVEQLKLYTRPSNSKIKTYYYKAGLYIINRLIKRSVSYFDHTPLKSLFPSVAIEVTYKKI